MRNRVLYFPYIRVPESRWFTQLLLYWDQISSIVPFEFIHKPELLGPYMCGLVREELVFQVIPGMYVYEIPRFDESFLVYLETLGSELEQRRRDFRRGSVFKIHMEKLEDIGGFLIGQQLARQVDSSWYEVERDTANDFMSYLATALGQLREIDSSPMTDETAYLRRFSRAGVPPQDMALQLSALRMEVLKKILPVPEQAVEPAKIRNFKRRYGDELGDFRRRVERELVDAVSITDSALRQRHLEIFYDEAEDRIRQIQSAMGGAGWNTVRAGLSIVAAFPGASPLLGLAGAVWRAVAGAGRTPSLDFAYAAHARAEFAPAGSA